MKVILLVITLATLFIILLSIKNSVENFVSISFPKGERVDFKEYSKDNPLTCNGSQSNIVINTKEECAYQLKQIHAQNPEEYLFGSYFDVRGNKTCRYGTGINLDKAKGCGNSQPNVSNWEGCDASDIQCYNLELSPFKQSSEITAKYPDNLEKGLYLIDVLILKDGGSPNIFNKVEDIKEYIKGDLQSKIKSVAMNSDTIKLYLKEEVAKVKPETLQGKEFKIIFTSPFLKGDMGSDTYKVYLVFNTRTCLHNAPGQTETRMQCPKYAEFGETYNLTGCLTRNDGIHGVYRQLNPLAKNDVYWKVSKNTTAWDKTCQEISKDKCGDGDNPKCAHYTIEDKKYTIP